MVTVVRNNRAVWAFLMAAAVSFGFETSDAFVPRATNTHRGRSSDVILRAEEEWSASSSAAIGSIHDIRGVTLHDKIELRDPVPDERGKGGVEVAAGASIKALEVLARVPRDLIISSVDAPVRAMEAASNARNLTWATDLTSATLVAMHPTEEELAAATTNSDDVDAVRAKKEWIESWESGGWATDGADLGPPDVNFGSKDVTGSLLSTGTDNDHNIYAKFRMPCHPVLLRASLGLEVLTQCTEEEAREALTARGFTYRSMRDALEGLVLESSERPKGSLREKRCWDVADTLSRVLSRATTFEVENGEEEGDVTLTHAVVPIHERLAHSTNENAKLVSSGNEILLVATQNIAEGEAITRDYSSSPGLTNDVISFVLRYC